IRPRKRRATRIPRRRPRRGAAARRLDTRRSDGRCTARTRASPRRRTRPRNRRRARRAGRRRTEAMAAKVRKVSTVEKKLVGVADVVIDAAARRKDPTLAIPVRSLSNVTFDEKKGLIELGKRKQARSFFNVGMAKKFMQTVLVADALAELQR